MPRRKDDLTWVVIPAYNEEKHIGEILEELRDCGHNVIVVDDGSTDHTSMIASEHDCYLLRHPINIGQWGALKTGFYVALLEGAEIIVTIDSDGQHSTSNLDKLIKPIIDGEADLVIGSRFLKRRPQMPLYRLLGIKLFNRMLLESTGIRLTDCTNGYKAYRRELLSKIFPLLLEPQYGALDSLIKLSEYNPRIIEVPVESIMNSKSSKGSLGYGYNLLRTVLKNV